MQPPDRSESHRATVSGGRMIQRMASQTKTVAVDAGLLERARRVAGERGVGVSQFVREALEHEMGGAEQPAVTCMGAFRSGRGDLSKLAGEDAFEPEPYR